MKEKHDYTTGTSEYKCNCCGYYLKTEKEDYDKYRSYDRKVIGDEDFIELGQTDIIKDKGGYYERIEKTTLYACPKCGCVHISI